jgi:carbon-monoxide dehydrogenase medium subunit
VIPAGFEYVRVNSVGEALDLLDEHGDDAKLLAGGHSLLPLMKLRLATPAVLVDLGPVSELSYVRDEGDEIAIGALTTHHRVATDPVVASEVPVLAHVAAQIGDPQVRHRGTIGGSIAHGDAAADLPALLLALGGSVVAVGRGGERVIASSDLHEGFLETSLRPEEVLTEVRVPKSTGSFGFEKLTKRAQDWAIVAAVAARRASDGGIVIGLVNMAPVPVRAVAVEQALAGGASAAEAAAKADAGTDPAADLNASADFRRHLARVLTRRALETALA